MSDFQLIARQFTEIYYGTFDRDRRELLPLYQPHSKLTWENQTIVGAEAIVEKIAGLSFKKVQHKITTLDAQITGETAILVLVTGLLIVDENTNPLQFSQIFILGLHDGRYFVLNDIFRLNYG